MKAAAPSSKSIILVEGGPGTGKSVIALDALGHALCEKQGRAARFGPRSICPWDAPVVGTELSSLVRSTEFFRQHEENSLDVLVVDEAHRIRAKPSPGEIGARNSQISQLEELVRAARVTVRFMDTNQVAEPDEGGGPDVASVHLEQIYRTLFTRALRSVRVYSVDEETRAYIRSKLVSPGFELLQLQSPRAAAVEPET
jgi:hypothetical protein